MAGHFRRSRALLTASVLTIAAVGLPITGASADNACKTGGTLTMARDQEPDSLVPWFSDSNGSIFFQEQVYEHLVEQMPGSPDVQPGLAQSWDISPDGLTYTFKLRPDAKFSNGDPVTADDVKFSFDRMVDPKIQVGWHFLMSNIKSFEAVDAHTFQLNMSQVDASVLYTLTLPAAGIVSKKAFDALGLDAFNAAPIGSGPFMIKQWTRGQNLEIVRNPNYWRKGEPYLDGVNFLLIPDDNARILKIQSGEADIAQQIPFSQAKQVGAMPGISVQVAPYLVGYGVMLNNTVKPLDEKVVRQALNYATPKDVINQVVFNGLGTPQNSMIPAARFWDSTVPAYPYDIDKAKALMAQSSVPNGFKIPLILSGSDSLSAQTAQILQSEWAKIGVTVDIQPGDHATVDKQYWDGNYTARLFSPSSLSSDTPDDSEWAGLVFVYSDEYKGFGTRYKSDDLAKLVQEADATVDSAKRQVLYAKLQRLGMDEAPYVPMIFSPTVTAVSNKIGGFQTMPSGWWRLEQTCFTQ